MLITLGKDVTDLVDQSVSGVALSGQINIDPNNGGTNGFRLTPVSGDVITRDDLHTNSVVDSTTGTYYEGAISVLLVNSPGNGSQDEFLVDGAPYVLEDGIEYTISGSGLTGRVYNDNVNPVGKPVGDWWVEVSTAGSSADVEEGDYAPVSGRLVEVNHQAGGVTHVMDLERAYDSLASGDGELFYAFSGDQLYAIDTAAGTETLVGMVSGGNVSAMEYAGTDLYGFDVVTDKLAPLDPLGTPVVGSVVSLGSMEDLGTMVIVPLGNDPALYAPLYD